jgi:hypothetical protein
VTKRSRWLVQLPATPAESAELAAAAKAERRTIGVWLLELGLQRARKASSRRPKSEPNEGKTPCNQP